MSLRSEAIAAYQGTYTDAARDVLVGVIGDPSGLVTALRVEDQQVTTGWALTVFTDGDLHLGVQIYTDASKTPRVGFVKHNADGTWTLQAAVTSLPQMGQIVGTVDPDTAS